MMVQIVTHPLYIRCRKVIESCTTIEQLKVSIKYCKLARIATKHPHKQTTDYINYFYDHEHYWKSLVEEAKWNLTKYEESTTKH